MYNQNLYLIYTQVHIRINAVPIKMDNDKIGQLVTASGIVVRMSQPTIIRLKKCYICTKCKNIHEVKASI